MSSVEDGNNYDLLYKIIITGDSWVGKTNILSRYVKNEFHEDSKSTVGVELGTKYTKIKETGMKVQIWDIAGLERYRSITSSYYKGSHGCLIVYDITNEKSFENVEKWLEQAKKEAGKDVSVILVGNKCDLEDSRKISKEQLEEKAKYLNCPFFETSALSRENIDQIFMELINNIYERTREKNEDEDDIEIIKENDKAVSLNSLFKNCSLNEHKNINAVVYCQNCNIYMCNKCTNYHKCLFNNHYIFNLENDMNEIFTGLCKEENHSLKLEYFCKTHNKLCCLACISKIKKLDIVSTLIVMFAL